MCVIEFDEYASVWVERDRKARASHKCSCCRRRIEAGEMYLTHFSVFDGSANSEKCCSDCRKDREEFAAAHDGATMSPGTFPMMVGDCISEADEDDSRWAAMLDRIWARRKGGA